MCNSKLYDKLNATLMKSQNLRSVLMQTCRLLFISHSIHWKLFFYWTVWMRLIWRPKVEVGDKSTQSIPPALDIGTQEPLNVLIAHWKVVPRSNSCIFIIEGVSHLAAVLLKLHLLLPTFSLNWWTWWRTQNNLEAVSSAL